MSQPKLFYWFDGQRVQGPVTGIVLRELAFQGRVTQATQVQLEGQGKWVDARRVKGLFDSQGRVLPHPAQTAAFLAQSASGSAAAPPSAPPASRGSTGASPSLDSNRPPFLTEHRAGDAKTTGGASPSLAAADAPEIHGHPGVFPSGQSVKRLPSRGVRKSRLGLKWEAGRLELPGSLVAGVLDFLREFGPAWGPGPGVWRAASLLYGATIVSVLPYLVLQTIWILSAVSPGPDGYRNLSLLTPPALLLAALGCLVFGHFILQRMAPVGERVVALTWPISTTAPYDCAGAIALLAGLLSLGAGLWLLAVQATFTAAAALLILSPCLTVVAVYFLNVDQIGLVADEQARLSDDALGFSVFLLKVGFLALPSLLLILCVGAMLVYVAGSIATILLLVRSFEASAEVAMIAALPHAVTLPLCLVAAAPLAAFLYSSLISLFLDLCRALLTLGRDSK